MSRTVSPLTIARASTILFLIELFPSSITNTETALVEFVSFVGRALFFVMASATFHSCSFSGLLHDATPCGLSSDYPGQVEVLACTRDISRHCELYGLKADTVLDTEWKPLFPRAGKILCTVLPSYVNLRVLSIQPKIPEVSVRNQMEWTIGSVLSEYLGTPLKLVHFDRSGYFGRSNRNVPFHLTKLLSPVLAYRSFVSCLQEQ